MDAEARFDEFVAINECPEYFYCRGIWPLDHHHQAQYQAWLIEQGLLEPGEPTPFEHERYRRRSTAPFSPEERERIRTKLGLAV